MVIEKTCKYRIVAVLIFINSLEHSDDTFLNVLLLSVCLCHMLMCHSAHLFDVTVREVLVSFNLILARIRFLDLHIKIVECFSGKVFIWWHCPSIVVLLRSFAFAFPSV